MDLLFLKPNINYINRHKRSPHIELYALYCPQHPLCPHTILYAQIEPSFRHTNTHPPSPFLFSLSLSVLYEVNPEVKWTQSIWGARRFAPLTPPFPFYTVWSKGDRYTISPPPFLPSSSFWFFFFFFLVKIPDTHTHSRFPLSWWPTFSLVRRGRTRTGNTTHICHPAVALDIYIFTVLLHVFKWKTKTNDDAECHLCEET